ncbi:hypothetical protein [Sporolactobacillus laevolacticus]|uniref:hypothetical protein n=1 Tax=Sporolactobacillus laevolacticus TaxID=33018 RepID=UPI0025B3560B|nr:hypothetical protein [Sporolactobacillus laevolacticus]MDN3956204.1 hypothetical protein [Sporolactobacillus laevolacticus]
MGKIKDFEGFKSAKECQQMIGNTWGEQRFVALEYDDMTVKYTLMDFNNCASLCGEINRNGKYEMEVDGQKVSAVNIYVPYGLEFFCFTNREDD